MEQLKLPPLFADRMKRMLGKDYDAFLAAYDRPNTPALRLNPMKTSDASLLECLKESVAWADGGYYYDPQADMRPGKHPYHEAGVYYIQEASAMIPASLCPPDPFDKVLDLCAAPGGKTTQLAANMRGNGLLVANEIHPQRAAILSQNVERMGIKNAVVTSHNPKELESLFPAFFDKIVVDAPCSGEGMFRKEESAVRMWSEENVAMCAQRQKDILESAAKMLAPGGYLTYSTCTFAPEENEGVILHFLKCHPDFKVVDPKNPAVLACIEKGLIDRGNPEWITDCSDDAEQIRKTLRLFPHHAEGEGHFAALLYKSEQADGQEKVENKDRKKAGGKDGAKNNLPIKKALELYEQFLKEVSDEDFDGELQLQKDQLILCPKALPTAPKGLRILRNGLHLGTIAGGNRFEPSHTLAPALDVGKAKKTFAVDLASAKAYLHGDTLPCNKEKGWYLITLDGFALGWGKASDGVMKNHYPKGLRRQY